MMSTLHTGLALSAPFGPLVIYGVARVTGAYTTLSDACANSTPRSWPTHPNPFEPLSFAGKIDPNLCYLLIGTVLASLSNRVFMEATASDVDFMYMWGMFLMAIGVGLVPTSINILYRVLTAWSPKMLHFVDLKDEDIKKWWKNELQRFWTGHGILLGTLIGGIIGFMAKLMTTGIAEPVVDVVIVSVTTVSACAVGAALVLLVRLCLICVHLGRLPLRSLRAPIGVASVNRVIVSVWLVAGLLYALYTSTSLLPEQTRSSADAAMILCALPAGIILLGGFVGSQYALHLGMVQYKEQRLRKTEEQMWASEDTFLKDLSPETGQNLKLLIDLYKEVAALPEWPFSWKQFVAVMSYTLGAMTPVLIAAMDLLREAA